jgi:YD repeat-containing protein
MKTIFACLALFISQCFMLNVANAQSGTLQAAPPNLVIDGDAKEWGDSLRYYNAERRINFSLANDKDNLYMAIRINDRVDQIKILHSGLTFSIDPKGKKKESFSITFPLNIQGSTTIDPRKPEPREITKADREELMREQITTLRGIKIAGFKDIEGDMITTSNTYGIQTAINYDENGNLVCEAAIPLKFFHTGDPAKNEWAFNFKINGFSRPTANAGGGEQEGGEGRGGRGGGMGGGGRGGMGGGGGRGGRGGSHSQAGDPGQSEMFKSSDFWTRFYLAR